MRQHSGVHEQVVAELFALGARRQGYAALPEAERRAWLLEELRLPRLLRSPYLSYSEEVGKELAILDTAAGMHRRYGAEALPNYVISKADGVSDLLEVALLLKEVGCCSPARQHVSTSTSFRCSRPSPTCRVAARSWTSCFRFLTTGRCWRAAATCRR